jgi:glycosyltransferase involved in cell wall biosynthesis
VPLARRAEELRVAGRVRWLGPQLAVRPALHAADAFVHASRSEGFPNALLEAFACGLPAALSDIEGHRDGDACPGDAALLFPPGDDAAMAAALARLLDEARPHGSAVDRAWPRADAGVAEGGSAWRPTARGRAARALAESRYDLGLVAEQMLALYAQCAPPRGRVSGGAQGAGGG